MKKNRCCSTLLPGGQKLKLLNLFILLALSANFLSNAEAASLADRGKAFKHEEGAVNSTLQQSGKFKISGQVTDAFNDSPIPGVNVIIKGTTEGIATNSDGIYELVVSTGDELLFSFVGYTTETVTVGTVKIINVRLSVAAQEIAEAVAVAFGKQKRESIVSAISTIKPDELKVPASNLTTALAGRMSGLISYQRSGEPGKDAAEFFVRGVTTFGYKPSPLILIDGVEFSATDLARLNTDDIASFSIMKDATSTALYGARGANGVILVTTKEGREGKAKINIRAETSMSTPTQRIKLADPITYMRMHDEAYRTRTENAQPFYSLTRIAGILDDNANRMVYPRNNWYDDLFNNQSYSQRVNANLSGGGKIAKYYVAASYSHDGGNLKTDRRHNFDNGVNFNNVLLRSNINVNVTRTTEIGVRFHGTFDSYHGPYEGAANIYNQVMNANPVLFPAVYEPDEDNLFTTHTIYGNYDEGQFNNPYAQMTRGYREENRTLMMAQLDLNQDLSFITEGLNFRGLVNTRRLSNFGYRRQFEPYYYKVSYYNNVTDKYTLGRINNNGTDYLVYKALPKKITSAVYVETALNYDRTFSGRHSVGALMVFTARSEDNSEATNFEATLPRRNVGLAGRITYGLDNKYFSEFNFGYNGSERFSKAERYGFFPSFGLGWAIHNENFWVGMAKTFTKFKITGTYGFVGNDHIGNLNDRFYYVSQVNINDDKKGYPFGLNTDFQTNGVSVSKYANHQITWETAIKSNLALDFELFGRLHFLGEIYHEYRKSILMPRSYIPASMGLEAVQSANVGEAQSRGIDISVDYNHSFSKDLWLSIRGNFTYASGTYKYYDEPKYPDAPWRQYQGRKLSQEMGYIAERLFIDEYDIENSPIQFGEYKPGDIKYKDVNGDGKISTLDMVPVGNPAVPEIVYGFGFSAGIKNFDMSAFFQGLANESFWIDYEKTSPFVNDQRALLQVYADNYWSETNQDIYARWPRLSPSLVDNNYPLRELSDGRKIRDKSSWFMQDGSFMRLKNAEIGYTLPGFMSKGLGIQSCRLYVSGTNLLTFSKFKLWDPEMAGNGLGYPVQKIYNVGLQLNF